MTSSRRSSTKIMMLAVIFAASVLSSSASANAVFVSGDVSGVWNADTVVVTDSINVIPGETLIIEPGVDILFLGYYKFEVTDGAVLHAVGTEMDPIRFMPFSEGDRSLGLDFINASSESILEYCEIRDALTSGIHLDNSSITIRNCLIEDSEAPTGSIGGGGIEILNGSNALIESNIIRNNYSADYGGGIYCEASSPYITGNDISGNLAGYYGSAAGGGIAVLNSSNSQILDNTISDNSVHPTGLFTVNPGIGGGIYVSGGSNIIIAGNIVSDNIVDWEPQTTTNGGGIFIGNSDPRIEGNVISGNRADSDNGGGLYLYNSDAEVINNTIAYNEAGDSGGAVYIKYSEPTIINSILYFNEATYGSQIFESDAFALVSYSDIEGGWYGMGNLDVDPLFRDPLSADYHLQDSQNCGDEGYSQLIDAGSPEYSDIVLDCSRGLGTELSDIGAFGGGQQGPVSVSDDNTPPTPSEYFLTNNYPNPFNASTTINYSISQDSQVRIDIYDELGRKVTTLVDSRQSAGEHKVLWNASEAATGLYFYRISAGDAVQTQKMLLLK